MRVPTLALSLLGIAKSVHGAADPQELAAPASICITYQTTYLDITTQTLPIDTGLPRSSRSSRLPSRISSTTQPSGAVAAVPVILSVVPAQNAKRQETKRDTGGFVRINGAPNPKVCSEASIFYLNQGQLLVEGRPVWVDPKVPFRPLRNFRPPPASSVTTRFEVVDGFLRWRNPAFVTGEARFCQVPSSGTTYIVLAASPADWPVDCLLSELAVIGGEIILPCHLQSTPSPWASLRCVLHTTLPSIAYEAFIRLHHL